MTKKKIIVFFAGVIVLSGCAKVHHLDQLLTLKELADEQTRMGEYVKEQDRKFDQMREEMQAGTLDQYVNQIKIQRTFGDPIFTEYVNQGGQELEVWLYRHATEFFGTEKIYLYFDSDGNLVESEYVEAKNGEVGEEAEKEDGL